MTLSTSYDPNEEIAIEENGQPLTELNKKEKNLFLRELVQPGLARVMFFDGEKLLSLYDQGNLANFIAESCRYLFGLNFVDLLNTDLNYYIHKLQGLQDPAHSVNP
jgi:DNA sulfur modification protein DndD